MQRCRLSIRALVFATGFAVFALSAPASADPPSRVARLGYMTDAVSFSPAGEDDWLEAAINRPLTTGDRLWVDDGGRAEIQFGGAMVRMNAGTAISILNLDDEIAQLQLSQGTLNVRVRRLEQNEVFEIDTPNLAFAIREPGEYRIEVDPRDDATTIFVRDGRGEAYGEGAAYLIDGQQPYRFTGTGLRDYQYVDATPADDFDRWSSGRDRDYDNSASARYVSRDVVGYQDLDANGAWRVDSTYGNVWTPNRVPAGWAPYRDGHWAWVDPWGWTWVDDAPWGFAVSHYGRWMNTRNTWCWVPGPMQQRAYYAPALVVFVGGSSFASSNRGEGVAWFPLGPREVYRPSYQVSRRYFEDVNRSNTVINTTVINNYYDHSNVTNVVYANRKVKGAIVVVPTSAFVHSQQVSHAALPVSRETMASAPVVLNPPVAPTESSVRGAATPRTKPASHAFERPVVVRTKPANASPGFAAQQRQLAVQPGKPLDDAARQQLRAGAAAATPLVKIVEPTRGEAPPTERPPKADRGNKPQDARDASAQPAPQHAQPAPQREQPAPQHEKVVQHKQPIAPTPAPPAKEPQSAPSQTATTAPQTEQHKQQDHARADKPIEPSAAKRDEPVSQQHDKGAQHKQQTAPTPEPTPSEPKSAPSQSAATAQQTEQHKQQDQAHADKPIEPSAPAKTQSQDQQAKGAQKHKDAEEEPKSAEQPAPQ